MNRLCNSLEPRVMDDDMLKLAVQEQGPQDEAGQLAKQEGILFKDVLSLQLDFQNILRIDNLWQFENLRKLQLDNNIIERIEGLENLTHLVWLDLSFNNIEAIEGLDALVNLEDLSLFNNRISKIDSLDALAKLQVLSLGNNQISNAMNIIYLRRFKDLRALSLSGNPIAEAEDYKMSVWAYLPDLVYLDSRRIDDHMETINMFERNIIDLVGLFIENVQSLMAQCRDLETHHHEKLLEICINTLEKMLKGELDVDLPEDVRALFVDKDTIVNAVGTSHDIHLLKIDNREDELLTRVNSWCTQLVDKIHKDEISRDRQRVREINQYIDHMQSELDNLEYTDVID